MWICPRSEKSLALLAALFLSLFVFVIAAGEARAEEQGVLPGTQWPQWCAAPPGTTPPGAGPPGVAPPDTAACPPTVRPLAVDTSPLDNPPAGSTANGTPPARLFPPPYSSVPTAAPGSEAAPWQQALPSPGAEGGLGPEPPIPTQSAPPEVASTPPDGRGSATAPTDQPRRPKILPEGALTTPGSATEPKPASSTPRNEGPVGSQPGSQPSSASDKLPAAKGVPTSSPRPPVGLAEKRAPS